MDDIKLVVYSYNEKATPNKDEVKQKIIGCLPANSTCRHTTELNKCIKFALVDRQNFNYDNKKFIVNRGGQINIEKVGQTEEDVSFLLSNKHPKFATSFNIMIHYVKTNKNIKIVAVDVLDRPYVFKAGKNIGLATQFKIENL